MPIIVDGKKIAQGISEDAKNRLDVLRYKPKLAEVLVGDNAASLSFLDVKRKACEKLGMEFVLHRFPETITTSQLRKRICEIRKKGGLKSVIVQLPLPQHINTQYILDAIPPEEDVDVLSSRARGLLATGKAKILPPTAGAVLEILRVHEVSLAGAHAVIVGLGALVGKPLMYLLADKVGSMALVHSSTPDAAHFTREADILITGAGQARLITGDMIKEGVVALDAGYSRIDGKVSGDLDYESVLPKARIITPVPGGIGPVTVAMLCANAITLAEEAATN
jgi:methylenetetrahydrofolate dehydrogenase (NADP+)/methenyltetrahydrofolate cyclohydrolase